MPKEIPFNNLQTSNLEIDAYYKGGTTGNISSDPISKILSIENMGGFRILGRKKIPGCKMIALYSTLSNTDWPDALDELSGMFTYYGDNKTPGHSLHETPKKGNIILRGLFDALHNDNRLHIPPIFLFTKGFTGRDVIFRGLAVPGFDGLEQNADLIAIWKSKKGERFQNYRAIFTILNIYKIPRKWIVDIVNENPLSENCPEKWKDWISGGNYAPLISIRTTRERSKDEQLPKIKSDKEMIDTIYDYFSDPIKFEHCAAEIARMMDKNIFSYDLTRPWRDGGRDAIGKYQIGLPSNSIDVDFALEAKRYNPGKKGVGIKYTSRLISRLKYRQFGILVTTSYVSIQAYKEIIEDGHPIIIISANDIIKILKSVGIANKKEVLSWLEKKFQ